MKLVYIGGAFEASTREEVENNIKAASRLAALVNDAGDGELFAVCPHPMGDSIRREMKTVPIKESLVFWLDGTMSLLMHCSIAIFRNSPGSEGTQAEMRMCKLLNIPYSVVADTITNTGMLLTVSSLLK